MTDTDNSLALARAFIDALNRGDQADAKAMLAQDVTVSQPLDDTLTGPEAVVANIWSYRNTFPDLTIRVTDGFAAADRAAVEFTAKGTYEPYTYGPQATQLTWRGCLIATARAGQLVGIDMYIDWLEPIQQLGGQGVVPVLKRSSGSA